MKGKKGKKKGASFSSDILHNSCDLSISSDVTDESLLEDKSFKVEKEFPWHFTVLFEDKHFQSKRIYSPIAVFIHPSVIRAYNCPQYFLVKGEKTFLLCMAHSLKSIKNSTIVFSDKNTHFKPGELVTLHPYTEQIRNAKNVTVHFDDRVTVDDDLKEHTLGMLIDSRFFYSGMKLKGEYLADIFQFLITNISCEELEPINDMNCLNKTDVHNNSLSFNETNSFSMESSMTKLLPSNSGSSLSSPKLGESSVHLESMLSSLNLNDSGVSHANSFSNQNDADVQFSDFQMPIFYTTYYGTSVHFDSNEIEETESLKGFSQIGGLQEELKELKAFINDCLSSKRNQNTVNVVLISGPSGTGKTLMLEAVRDEYDVHFEEIIYYRLYLKSKAEIKQDLQQMYQRINSSNQSIILIDDFSKLCPLKSDAKTGCFAESLKSFIRHSDVRQLLIISVTNDSNYNDSVLSNNNTSVKKVKFHVPTESDREDILNKLLSTRHHNLSSDEIKQIALHSQSFTGRDLLDVLDYAEVIQHVRTDESSKEKFGDLITFINVKHALRFKKPSIINSNVKIKKVNWSNIGGMMHLKAKLMDIVGSLLENSELCKVLDRSLSRGILLFGPPGCSKTMIARALATECGLNFISKNVSDILSKYVGESEKAVSGLFELAREKSPCIIFLDEIDALVPERGCSGESAVGERIVTSFLTEMDGIEDLGNVIILAATNRPDRLDAAFLRNGRIDHLIYVPLPDFDTREEILKLQMKNRVLAGEVDYKYLASRTEGYSGAEIVNLCNEAAFQILAEDIESVSPVFTLRHFEKALKAVLPRTMQEMINLNENFSAKFCSK